jgi:hypothetical protein
MRRIGVFFATGLLAASVSQVQAAPLHVSIAEPTDDSPTVTTDIPNASTSTAFETAGVIGAISIGSTNGLPVGTFFVTLNEPDVDQFGPRISDIVSITISAIDQDDGNPFQTINLNFYSDGFSRFNQIIPPGVVPPFVTENGGLQDLTAKLGLPVNTDGTATLLQVSASSDLNSPEIPEPGSLALFSIGAAGVFGYASRKRKHLA